MVDLLGGRAADMTAAVQEDFKQADDARVVDLDPGIADRALDLWFERVVKGRLRGEARLVRYIDDFVI